MNMSEEEENVFDRLISVLSDVDETLKLATEALIVIATEMYTARRDLTKLIEQINDSVSKIAGKAQAEWKETPEEVKQPERFEAVVMPSSTPEWMKKEEK